YRVIKMYRYTDEDKARIKKARKENKNKRVEKRLQALELRAEGKSANEVAAVTGFHPSYLTQLSRKYQQGGIEAITGNHYAGNRRNMSFEEETAILEPFREAAEKGQLVETSEIKASYEQAIGHPIGGSQIYYVLKRHGWRKVMPRSRHPKRATEEVIETSNKLKKDFRAE
ncbi:MAG: winged helix-turn-helix domain-containing protein, partial [Oscillospiraceae bacterium]|nr:winged helix-turn-helix domain-containing protein [Oscillospiraceae bacterium]